MRLIGHHLHSSQKNTKVTCNFVTKRLQHRYFPMHVAKFSTTAILKNIYEGLVLIIKMLALIPSATFTNHVKN